MFKVLCSLFLVTTLAFGAEGGQDFPTFSRYLQDKFSQFKNDPSTAYTRAGSPAYAAQYPMTNGKINYNLSQFPAGDSRNYVKGQIEEKVSSLAQALAQTAGTALAFQNATQLRQQASELNASGDPDLQKMGTELNQEASAIEQGNQAQATQYANQISSTPMPYVSPNYTPGPQEDAFVNALKSVIGGIAMASIGLLTGNLANQLLSSLGLGNGFGGVASSGAQGLVSGQNPSNVASNTGAAAAYTGGSQLQNVTTNKINSVTAPSGSPAGNSGSLPSAGK